MMKEDSYLGVAGLGGGWGGGGVGGEDSCSPTFLLQGPSGSLDEAEVKGEVRQVGGRGTGECISDLLHDHLLVRLFTFSGP